MNANLKSAFGSADALLAKIGAKSSQVSDDDVLKARKEAQDEKDRQERNRLWSNVGLGARYERCRLDNFVKSDDAKDRSQQEAAISSLREYGESITERVESGRNILLWGPSRTGKDHLLVELIHSACREMKSVRLVTGSMLFREYLDVLSNRGSQVEFVRSFTYPDVLVLSDPAPVSGESSESNASVLCDILDARLRLLRPTWVTTNLVGKDEASQKLGVRVMERLRQDSLILLCDWGSYRFS